MSNIGDAELKIDASDQGNLEIMQQDSKEMVTVDEVVEIEKAAYQNYKAEVMTVTLKASYSQVHVACLSKVLLPTPTFQDINGSIELVGVSLSSLLPQMKKQKSHYIIWFYKALLPQDKGSLKCFIWESRDFTSQSVSQQLLFCDHPYRHYLIFGQINSESRNDHNHSKIHLKWWI